MSAFAVGQRVMTATSNPFVANRRGVIAEVWTHDRYVMDDKGLRLVLHASELVPDDIADYRETLREIEVLAFRQYVDWMHFHELAMVKPFEAEAEAQDFARRVSSLATLALGDDTSIEVLS